MWASQDADTFWTTRGHGVPRVVQNPKRGLPCTRVHVVSNYANTATIMGAESAPKQRPGDGVRHRAVRANDCIGVRPMYLVSLSPDPRLR